MMSPGGHLRHAGRAERFEGAGRQVGGLPDRDSRDYDQDERNPDIEPAIDLAVHVRPDPLSRIHMLSQPLHHC